jgi:hypothetical protein
VGHHTSDETLIDKATKHAHAVLKHVVRSNMSTYHLVNFSPIDGTVKQKMTNQGFSDESTWSRGQAWGILGFTQVYSWTKNLVFLEAAIGLTKYFLGRLDEAKHEYPYVPVWDFDAPQVENEPPLRDTSAGMIVVNGLLLLHQLCSVSPVNPNTTLPSSFFLDAALKILRQTIALSLSKFSASFSYSSPHNETLVRDGDESFRGETFDGILRNATANANPDAIQPYSDHGLVYADYYFIEAGNKLLRMGILL